MPICLKVKVVPGSNESKIEGNTIKVKSSPRNNKANLEVMKLVSKKYKVPLSNIKIIGKTSRNKTIIIKE